MKRKKRKIKYKNIFLILIIFVFSIYGISKLKPKDKYMLDVTNMNYQEAIKLLEKYNLNITTDYEYNNEVEIDKIINQSIFKDTKIEENQKLNLTVSLGKIDKEKLKKDNINELGYVPIMMYHGIKDIPSDETQYTGGNVDKDGYTRTAEAFRKDLEFYYQEGYRMIKLSDYIEGKIDVEYGYSPIVLTFDDGNANNIEVIGKDTNGNIIINPNSAVGILEEFKKKYPDFSVTAIFFITNNLFNQKEYDEEIINWLIDNDYEVGNHTKGHNNFTKTTIEETEEVVGYMYQKLDKITNGKYSKIIALPYGSPYDKNHQNYKHILNGKYEEYTYETLSALRVGWEPEVSPFNKDFDKYFLKRCRAYDNNGKDFDIEMVFKNLQKNKYISDGNIDTIVTKEELYDKITKDTNKEIILY